MSEPRLVGIENSLGEIRMELGVITEQIEKLSIICSRMDSHISNVENAYSTVRRPVGYLLEKIQKFMGVERTELPALESMTENGD